MIMFSCNLHGILVKHSDCQYSENIELTVGRRNSEMNSMQSPESVHDDPITKLRTSLQSLRGDL